MGSMLSRFIDLSSGQRITCADPKTQLEYAGTDLCGSLRPFGDTCCRLRPFGQRREGFFFEKNACVPLLRSLSEKQCLRTGSRTHPTHCLSEDGQTVARPNRFPFLSRRKILHGVAFRRYTMEKSTGMSATPENYSCSLSFDSGLANDDPVAGHGNHFQFCFGGNEGAFAHHINDMVFNPRLACGS